MNKPDFPMFNYSIKDRINDDSYKVEFQTQYRTKFEGQWYMIEVTKNYWLDDNF